jgi:hypothetical protein
MNDHQSQSNQQFSLTFGVLTTGLRLWKPWYQWMLKRRSIRNFINLFGCYFIYFLTIISIWKGMFFFSFFQVVRPTGVQQNEWAMFLPLAHEVYYIQLFCFSLTKGCLCTGRVYVVKKKILCFFFSLFLTYKNIMNSKNKNTQSPSTFSSVRIYSPRIRETPVEKKRNVHFHFIIVIILAAASQKLPACRRLAPQNGALRDPQPVMVWYASRRARRMRVHLSHFSFF